ncbi:hypothetical protein ACFLZY_01790 [Patescibacteria group bacterium]
MEDEIIDLVGSATEDVIDQGIKKEILTDEKDDGLIHVGSALVGWEVDEYPQHDRSRLWFLVAGIVGVALIVYSVATANMLFAVIVLMIGVIILVSSMKTPDKVQVIVTTTGVLVGDSYYEYKDIKDFAIVYNPPETKLLYIDFESGWKPLLSIPLEDTDPNEVRESLLPYVIEDLDRTDERLTDVIRRLYKL